MSNTVMPEENSGPTDDRDLLYAEQVMLIYRNAPAGLIATIVNSLTLAFILRNVVSYPLLIAWLASILLITSLRFLSLYRYKHTRIIPSEARGWGKLFVAGAALSGILWGSSALFIFPSESVIHQVFIAFVLGGMAIGAIGAYSIIMPASLFFNIPALTPIIIRFFLIGDEEHIVMGGMTLLFAIIVHTIGFRLNAVTKNSLNLRFENTELLSRLREGEKKYRDIVNNALVGVFQTNLKGDILYVNDTLLQIFEFTSPDEAMSINVITRYKNPQDRGVVIETLKREGRIIGAEVEMITKTGRAINVLFSAVLEEDAIFGTLLDITERKEAEEKLRKSEEKLRAITSVLGEGVYVLDKKGCLIFLNPEAENLLGWKMEELLGREIHGIIHFQHDDGSPIDFEECPVFKTMQSGKTYKVKQDVFTRKDGKMLPVSYVSTPFIVEGEITGAVTAFHDITERLQTMEELRNKKQQLEELNRTLEQRVAEEVAKGREKDQMMMMQGRQAAMGEMIGNIAHQWRQPLNAIGLLIQDIKDAYRYGEMNGGYLNRSIKKGIEIINYMSHTIDDFRNFFRPEREKHPFNLKEGIDRAISFVDASFESSGIRIGIDVVEEIAVMGYSNEYSQVILNILNNARDALLENGIEDPLVKIRLFRENGMGVVTISDNAGGIPENIIERIFDPYFSTKETGKGTGIGLYMSKMIIERNMEGRLTARNIDKGAEFRIEVTLNL